MRQAIAEFTWDEAEYVEVTRKYGFPKLFVRSMAYGAAIFIALGILLGVVGKRAGWFLCVLGVVYAAYGLWFASAVPRRRWRKSPGTKGPWQYVFTDEGVTTHSRVSDKFDRWEFYTYVSERDEWYLLGRSRHIATVFVPKRGFASPADEAVFRCLVRAHAQASLLASPAIDDPTGQPPPVPPD